MPGPALHVQCFVVFPSLFEPTGKPDNLEAHEALKRIHLLLGQNFLDGASKNRKFPLGQATLQLIAEEAHALVKLPLGRSTS